MSQATELQSSQSAFYAARQAGTCVGAPSPASREMTPAEPSNPAWTERNSAWAGCPFNGAEALNVASVVGYLRAIAAHTRPLDVKEDLQRMADVLSVTGKKIRERCTREAMMAEAQR